MNELNLTYNETPYCVGESSTEKAIRSCKVSKPTQTYSLAKDASTRKSEIGETFLCSEIWKPALGFEGIYEVSNFGNVLSLNYRNHHVQNLLKQTKDGSGYLFVMLRKDGKYHAKKIHRLVYETFVGKLPDYVIKTEGDEIFTIDHVDGDKTNNRLDNLELVTHTENSRRFLAKNGGSVIEGIYQYTKDYVLVNTWKSLRECERNGYDRTIVSLCCRNKYYKKKNEYKGCIWSYKKLK